MMAAGRTTDRTAEHAAWLAAVDNSRLTTPTASVTMIRTLVRLSSSLMADGTRLDHASRPIATRAALGRSRVKAVQFYLPPSPRATAGRAWALA